MGLIHFMLDNMILMGPGTYSKLSEWVEQCTDSLQGVECSKLNKNLAQMELGAMDLSFGQDKNLTRLWSI